MTSYLMKSCEVCHVTRTSSLRVEHHGGDPLPLDQGNGVAVAGDGGDQVLSPLICGLDLGLLVRAVASQIRVKGG